jgi:hypothetical protein
MTRPLTQIGDDIREMTDEEIEALPVVNWTIPTETLEASNVVA